MDYRIIREYPNGKRETAGYWHGAPEKDSPGWPAAFGQWVTNYAGGAPGGCGYEAVPLQAPDPWTGLYIVKDETDQAEREAAIIDAVFNGGPMPGRAAMPPERVIREWIESTEDAIKALRCWLGSLREWERNGGQELAPGDLDVAFRALVNVMGDGWADRNPAGGGLDRLAEVVTRETGSLECTCNEPGSPAAVTGGHAPWCPAYVWPRERDRE